MKTQKVTEAARALVTRRRRIEAQCQDCGRQIWGYPGKLRCQRCKRRAAYSRRKALLAQLGQKS